MRRLLLLLLVAGCAGSAHVAAPSAEPVRVQLLAFNDFHGNLEPPPATARAPDAGVSTGGVAWLAAHVAQLRQQEPTLVVAAGDLVGASPLPSALTHDEPSIAALDALGLDLSSVGNHEFDEGVEELKRLQRGGCHAGEACPDGPFPGARFTYLAANVVDRTGATIFPGSVLKQVGGATVGFVGVVLRDTPTVVTPNGIAGLTFLDEADTVNALVPKLKAAGADAVVVLIHQGATPAPGTPTDGCRGMTGGLIELTQRFRGVDVVVSGHTHQAYVCPDLGGMLVTSAGAYGRLLTRISLELDPVQHRVLSRSAVQVAVTHDLPPTPGFRRSSTGPCPGRHRSRSGPSDGSRRGSRGTAEPRERQRWVIWSPTRTSPRRGTPTPRWRSPTPAGCEPISRPARSPTGTSSLRSPSGTRW